MDENMLKYIYNDIMVTHIMSEKTKAAKLNKRVNRLTVGFILFAFITASYISVLVTNSNEQYSRISKLEKAITGLKGAKGE